MPSNNDIFTAKLIESILDSDDNVVYVLVIKAKDGGLGVQHAQNDQFAEHVRSCDHHQETLHNILQDIMNNICDKPLKGVPAGTEKRYRRRRNAHA